MHLIYNLFSFLALVIYFPRLIFKRGPEKKSVYIKERLGLSEYSQADIWVHAVSVGEVTACEPFLKAVKSEFPGIKITLSTITYTGQKIARERFPGADRIMYMPWDTGPCIKRAVRMLSPRIFITIETELWPLLFKALRNKRTRIAVLNGRLSPESFRGYRLVRPFMRKVLSCADFFYMQGPGDADRIASLGAERDRIRVMGNFKFDINFRGSEGSAEWLGETGGKILVAGSTHRGEEEIIMDSYETAGKRINNLKIVIAPRHPERFSEVEDLLRKRKFNFIKRSEIKQVSDLQFPDIILLDTIGELSQVYSKADISFVGGSLLPFGGHNILEPAYWGKPVLFGPYMENFPFAAEFIKENAAIEVKDAGEMASAIEDLLKKPEKAGQMGHKAKKIMENNTGAVETALDLVRDILGTS